MPVSVLLLCLFSIGCNLHEPVGIELTYAFDRADAPTKTIDMQKVLRAVQRRVRLYGTAELAGDRVKIGVFGSDKKNADRVKDLIARSGVLEFRILADRRFDDDLIELATAEQFTDKRDVRKKSNDEFPVAQWYPVEEVEGRRLAADKNLVTRGSKTGTLEDLVVIDPYHVTGDDFSSVFADTDQNGEPCISFKMSSDGARRMRRLTLENLPSKDDPPKVRLLGIILEGQLQTAPSIRSEISMRGLITGKYSEQEANDLSLILMAGSLPVHLKLIDEKIVTAGGQ